MMRARFKDPSYIDRLQEKISEYSLRTKAFSDEEITKLKSSNLMIEIEKTLSRNGMGRVRLLNVRNGALTFPLKELEILPHTELHSKYIDQIRHIIIDIRENDL